MSSSLNVHVALSHPYVPSTIYSEEPLYALLEVEPTANQDGGGRPPLNLVLVVDSSATMHHFQLNDEEREYWMGLAISRDEMERGTADERNAIYWTGQTLAEMQSVAMTPMAIVVEGIKNLLATLQPTDKVAVVAFADQVHTVFNEQDWLDFPDQCLAQMDFLREQRLPVDIGTGTHMSEALRTAGQYLEQYAAPNAVNRLIIVSDGIVQDPDQTLQAITFIQDKGYAITTLGVGEEFDEEFLMRVADNSRGDYYYAADITEITDRLQQEMITLQATAVTDLYIAVHGLEGAVVQELYLVRPTMSLFDEIHTEDGWLRARVGDVSSAAPAGVLIQLAPPTLPEGPHPIAEAQLTWASPDAGAPQGLERATIAINFTDDPDRLAEVNHPVTDLVDRFQIYKLEREAQRAQERGDLETAKSKLGAATRELHKIGEESLAQDMESQIAALGEVSADSTRVKRIKATTRRLGNVPTEAGTSGE